MRGNWFAFQYEAKGRQKEEVLEGELLMVKKTKWETGFLWLFKDGKSPMLIHLALGQTSKQIFEKTNLPCSVDFCHFPNMKSRWMLLSLLMDHTIIQISYGFTLTTLNQSFLTSALLTLWVSCSVHYKTFNSISGPKPTNTSVGDFSGGPVVKNPPSSAGDMVQSLVTELISHMSRSN